MLPAHRVVYLLCLPLLFSACKTASPATKDSASLDSGGPLMAEQAAFDVQHYDLQLRVDPSRKFISGTGTVEVLLKAPLSWLVLDLDPRLKVSHVTGKPT